MTTLSRVNQIYLEYDRWNKSVVSKFHGASAAAPALNDPVIPLQGMFRSGTNYARTLLELNYDCKVIYNYYGWKHSFIPIITRDSEVRYDARRGLVITKHPLHQLKSLKDYVYSNGRNVSCAIDSNRFLNEPFRIFDSASRWKVEYFFETPVAYYNAMTWNLLSSCNADGMANLHIQYEAISRRPQDSAAHIAAHFGLQPRRQGSFQDVKHKTRNMSDSAKRFDATLDTSVYTMRTEFKSTSETEIRAYWSAEDLKTIERQLNAELCDALRYWTFL